MGEAGADLVHVMQHGDDGAALRVPFAHQCQQVLRGGGIKCGERFIEHDDGGIGHEQAREQEALELPCRERIDHAPGLLLQPHAAQRIGRALAYGPAGRAKGPGLAPCATEHHVGYADGKGTVNDAGLRAQDFGYLPQARIIDRAFPISVTDMVLGGAWRQTGAFGAASRAVRQRAADALCRVGLEKQAGRMIDALSAGQFQRLLFARLLMTDASVIMLDEPFTALDAPTTQDLLALVREWHAQGRTIIAVLHDMHQIRTCFPHVVLLSGGQAIWGETARILTPGTLQRAYDTPQATPWAGGPA